MFVSNKWHGADVYKIQNMSGIMPHKISDFIM